MQFKNPEILYALFLLIIPILIHLFQLRRFRKTEFTNVKFLKEVTLQTRKSSQLKKWLILFSRLLALTALILAFAQPYIPAKTNFQEKELVIYLDNSFSMQAKGAHGELLKTAVQQLVENSDIPEKVNWFTNNQTFRDNSVNDFKNQLIQLDYSSNQLTYEEVLLKAGSLFSIQKDTQKTLLLLSDFQSNSAFPTAIENNFEVTAIKLKPETVTNITVDSIYISSISGDLAELTAIIRNYGSAVTGVPVSMYAEETLAAKTAVDIPESGVAKAIFEINAHQGFNGKVSVTDESLRFDNELFFNIPENALIKVMVIQNEQVSFLNKIFTPSEFDLLTFSNKNLDYNHITQQNTIILNQLSEIPTSLQTALQSFSENGGTLVIIPATDIHLDEYNRLLTSVNLPVFEKKFDFENQITSIQFSHPLYQNVFENQVTNFQYPTVNSFYTLKGNPVAALSFQDQRPFLLQSTNNYLFTASLDVENSNFVRSPLVVPTFYRMAKLSLPLPDLYFTIGKENRFAVPISLTQNQILTLKGTETNLIPLQQNTANKVIITTTDEPAVGETYTILNGQMAVQQVSYNYNRSESNMQYLNISNVENIDVYEVIGDFFTQFADGLHVKQLWKWFVIFALIFICIEILLIKFLK